MRDAVAVPHKLLPPTKNILYETLRACVDWTMFVYTCNFQFLKSGHLTSLRTIRSEVPLYIHVHRYVSVVKLEMRKRRKK